MRLLTLMENESADARCACEHGLSLYIQTARHRLLMDTGASGAFADNAAALGVDLNRVDTVVLSHGHYDHAGGLLRLGQLAPGATIYMQRGADGDFYHGQRYIGMDKAAAALPGVRRVDGELVIDEELALFAGVTGRRLWPQSNRALTVRRDGDVLPDDFAHEQCLVITEGARRVLLSGCAHNGILNILDRYRQLYGGEPDVAISGFHMRRKGPHTEEEREVIRQTALELKKTRTLFYTGHCTGAEAFGLMADILGEQLRPMHAGMELDV